MPGSSKPNSPGARPFLVTGGTGQQGAALSRELLRRGHKVRAATRDPTKEKAKELQRLGAEIVQADFDKPDSIERAARGTSGAFIMATPFEKGPATETAQATAAIDAVVDANVPFILYSSVCDADQHTGIPHFDSKALVEEHLHGSSVPHAIVAPAFFRENLLSPWMLPGIQQGRLDLALSPDRGLQNIELSEIAAVTADVLENPAHFTGKRINIASDETSPKQMAAAIQAASGIAVGHNQVPILEVEKQSKDSALMFAWFEEKGYTADIAGLRRQFPKTPWRGFTAWAKAQSWTPAAPPSVRTPVPQPVGRT